MVGEANRGGWQTQTQRLELDRRYAACAKGDVAVHNVPGHDHFTVCEALGEESSSVHAEALRLLQLRPKARRSTPRRRRYALLLLAAAGLVVGHRVVGGRGRR